MKKYFAASCLIFLLANADFFSQPPRRLPLSAVPPEKVEIDNASAPEFTFAEKGLPEPTIIGANPSDALAAMYAKEISKYDERSLSMLMSALQKAGFFIMDQNGKMLYTPTYGNGNGVGMSFYDFEVVGMLKGANMGASMTMAQFSQTFAQNDKVLAAAASGDVLLEDLRNATASQNPQVRFIAALIFALGRELPTPIDLRTATPEKATLNLIQASLIERTLLGDFIRHYEATTASALPFRSLDKRVAFRTSPDGVSFINASYQPPVSPCETITDITAYQKAPKYVKKVIETVLIYKEFASGKDGINAVIDNPNKPSVPKPLKWLTPDILKDIISPKGLEGDAKKEWDKKYGLGMQGINAILAWTKLVVALSNIKAKIEVEDPVPLERVKHARKPGGYERKLKATFTMDIGNSDLINCVGKSFGAITSISFSVPKGGPMKNVPVAWELLDVGENLDKFVVNPVYLDSLEKDDVSKKKTDANGETTVQLIGKPQRESLEGQALVPKVTKAVFRVRVAIEDMKAEEDLPKILSGIGLGPSISPLAIVSLIPSMMSKMKLSVFKASVPVKDWQRCSADWGGTISVKLVRNKPPETIKANRLGNGNSTGEGTKTFKMTVNANVTLNPRTDEEIAAGVDKKPAALAVDGKIESVTERLAEKNPCCGKTEGNFLTRIREGSTADFSKIFYKLVNVNARVRENDHEVGFTVSTGTFPITYHNFKEVPESDCEEDQKEANMEDVESIFEQNFVLPEGRYGNAYGNTAGEVLQGTKEFGFPDGSTFTWTWSLARCKG